MKNSSQVGFSIIELLISAGIMFSLLLAFSQMMLNSHRFYANLETKVQFAQVAMELKNVFGNQALCNKSNVIGKTFTVPTLSATPSYPISLSNSVQMLPLEVGAENIVAQDKIIVGARITSLKADQLLDANVANRQYQTRVILEGTKANGAKITESYNLGLILDLTNKIVACYLVSETMALELRTSDPPAPYTGQMWLRTDLAP